MKSKFIFILAAVIAIGLSSCAGTPVEDTGMEGRSVEQKSMEKEAEIIVYWEPAFETVMFVDGSVDKQIEYVYDNDGSLQMIVERNARDELLYKRDYVYEGGILDHMEMSDDKGLVSVTSYELDGKGQITKEIKTDANDDVLSTISFEYDENGLVVETVAYDSAGVLQLTAEYAYEGEIVSTVVYLLPGGTEEARFVRTLENGLAVEEQTILPDGTVETSRSFEYEAGRLAKETHFAEGTKIKSVSYVYDADGNVVRDTWANRSGKDYEVVERQWLKFEKVQ